MDGQQFDSNSGNAFALTMAPDQLQAEPLGMGETGQTHPIDPTLATSANPNADQGLVFGAMLPAVASA